MSEIIQIKIQMPQKKKKKVKWNGILEGETDNFIFLLFRAGPAACGSSHML